MHYNKQSESCQILQQFFVDLKINNLITLFILSLRSYIPHHVFASVENSKTVVLIDDIYMCDWLQ